MARDPPSLTLPKVMSKRGGGGGIPIASDAAGATPARPRCDRNVRGTRTNYSRPKSRCRNRASDNWRKNLNVSWTTWMGPSGWHTDPCGR